MDYHSSALLLAIAINTAAAQTPACQQLSTSFDVSGSRSVQKVIGNGLQFRLQRDAEAKGWSFEIGPLARSDQQLDTYIYALTPPWRGRHVTMLHTAYATPAQDIADTGERQFWFLLNTRDAPAASTALNAVLWQSAALTQDQALAVLGGMPKGIGVLRVVDADIIAATNPTTSASASASADAESDFGEVRRLKIQLGLVVPTSFKAAAGWRVSKTACPNQNTWPDLPQ